MLQKKCSHCKKYSYSSGDWYRWLCPYCGKDLTSLKATSAGHPYVSVRPLTPHRYQKHRHPSYHFDGDTA